MGSPASTGLYMPRADFQADDMSGKTLKPAPLLEPKAPPEPSLNQQLRFSPFARPTPSKAVQERGASFSPGSPSRSTLFYQKTPPARWTPDSPVVGPATAGGGGGGGGSGPGVGRSQRTVAGPGPSSAPSSAAFANFPVSPRTVQVVSGNVSGIRTSAERLSESIYGSGTSPGSPSKTTDPLSATGTPSLAGISNRSLLSPTGRITKGEGGSLISKDLDTFSLLDLTRSVASEASHKIEQASLHLLDLPGDLAFKGAVSRLFASTNSVQEVSDAFLTAKMRDLEEQRAKQRETEQQEVSAEMEKLSREVQEMRAGTTKDWYGAEF